MVDRISTIDKLSPYQLQRIEELCSRWQTAARSAAVDRPAVEKAIACLYENAPLKDPLFIWCESPFQYVTMNAFLFLLAIDDTNAMANKLDCELKEPLWLKSWADFKAQLERAPELVEQMRLRMKEGHDGKPIIPRSSIGTPHLMEHVGNTDVEHKLLGSDSTAISSFEKVFVQSFGVKAKLQLRTFLSKLRDGASVMLRGRFPERAIRGLVPGNTAEQLANQLSDATNKMVNECCDFLTLQKSMFGDAFGTVKPKPIDALFSGLLSENTILIPDRRLPVISDQMIVYAFVADEIRTILEGRFAQILDSKLTINENGVDFSPYKFVCFVTEPPTEAVFNQRNFLHNQDGPAMTFRDGSQVFAINGVTIPESILRDAITIKQIDAEQNVEVRRIMIQLYGMAKYIEDSGAKIISSDEYGVLYKKDLAMDEPVVILKVINATKEPDGSGAREFFLRVPPYMITAKDAVAWTFQMDGSDYMPDQES